MTGYIRLLPSPARHKIHPVSNDPPARMRLARMTMGIREPGGATPAQWCDSQGEIWTTSRFAPPYYAPTVQAPGEHLPWRPGQQFFLIEPQPLLLRPSRA